MTKLPRGDMLEMYATFCCEEATQMINNNRLKPMYEVWAKLINEISGKYPETKYKDLTSPSLLTCSDSYLKREKKIMLIGKEAHHDRVPLSDVFYRNRYLTDQYYDYEYEIFKGSARESNFLKTRRLLSGINDYNSRLTGRSENGFDIMSLLVNNLNKTSYLGQKTACTEDLQFIYEPFVYDGLKANVFVHELNILRPDVLVMLTGRGYDKHIERAFGNEFYNFIKSEHAFNIEQNKKTVSDTIRIDTETIEKWYGIKKYSFNVIYGFHPSSRMKKQARCQYEESLLSAIC